jgi:hypothetical protein
MRADAGSELDRARKETSMERNVRSFFKYILLPTLGCAILAINFVVGSYSAGGRDGDDFLKGVLFGATIAFWLVCLYSWGVVISRIRARSKRPTW